MGRELFGVFRRNVGTAETGAISVYADAVSETEAREADAATAAGAVAGVMAEVRV